MADSISKKVLIEIDLANDDANVAVTDLKNKVDALKASVVANKQAISDAKAAQAQFNTEMAKSKLNQQEAKAAIDAHRLATLKANEATKQSKAAVQAAAGSYDEADKKLKALARTIKSAEGGFRSTDPEIKKQIVDYKALNKELTAFDAQLGNHQRKVGQYENSLNGLESILNKVIPGFNRFSGAIHSASQVMGFMPTASRKVEGAITSMGQAVGRAGNSISNFVGFKQFGSQAKDAAEGTNELGSASKSAGADMAEAGASAESGAEGVAGLSSTMVGLIAAAVAVVAIIGLVASWFAKLTPNAESLQRKISGLGGAYNAFMSDLGKGVGFKQLFNDMKNAYDEAEKLKGGMQDLARDTEILAVANAQADAKIADLQLKMRNRRNTPEQEKAYFNQIQQISQQSYTERKRLADQEFKLAVQLATNGRKFSEDIRDNIMKNGVTIRDTVTGQIRVLKAGVEAAAYYDKQLGLRNKEGAGTDVAGIAKAQEDQAAAERYQETIKDRAQNRLDAQQLRDDARAQAAAEKAERLKEKAAADLAEAQRSIDEANSERRASIAKMLQDQMDDLARELSIEDEKHRQKLFKEQEFQAKMALLRDRTKNPAAKAKFGQAITASKGNVDQDEKETNANKLKIIEDYNKAAAQEIQKAENELKAMQIASINDEEERERQSLAMATAEKREAIARDNKLLEQSIERINKQLKDKTQKLSADEIVALQQKLANEQKLLELNRDKSGEIRLQDQQAQLDIIKKYRDLEQAELDKASVDKAQGADEKAPTGKNNKNLLDARQKELIDTYNAEVSNKKLTDDAKLLLEQQYITKRDELNRAYELKRYNDAVKIEQTVQSAATTIIGNAIQHNAQVQEVSLEKQKNYNLQNTSLTSTQRFEVEERYRIKSGQAKVKEFKQNQKLQEANALINLLVGEGRLWVDPGFPEAIPLAIELAAQGALQIAEIASQKAPAYAKGRGPVSTHYVSDGKGTLLKGPGNGKSDSMHARVSNGEAIINARSTSMFKPLLSAINEVGGGTPFVINSTAHVPWVVPHFSTGGVANTYSPSSDSGLRIVMPSAPVNDGRIHADDIGAIVDGITNGTSNAIRNMPQPLMDIKDVNRQQQLLAIPQDRSNR